MTASRRPGATKRELVWVLIVALLIVGVFLADAWRHGALDVPRDDDWSYLKTAFNFHETGVVDLNGWAYTTLIGQVLLAWPLIEVFGQSIVVLQFMVAAFSVLGIVLTYALLRQIASIGVSAVALTTLVLGPIYGTPSTNFMTDVPVLALQMATLAFGVVALRQSRSWVWLSAATLAGVAAFSIRQSGIVALALVYALFVVRWRMSGRSSAPAIYWALAIAAMVLPIYAYRQSLPNGVYSALDFPPFPRPGFTERLVTVARSFTTLALMTSPALLLISPIRLVRTIWLSSRLGTVIALAVSLVLVGAGGTWLLGNHVHPFGDTWMVAGAGTRLLPLNLYRLVLLVAVVSLLLLVLLLALGAIRVGRHAEAPISRRVTQLVIDFPIQTLLYGFAVISFLANVGATLVLGAPFIDRYLIASVPFAVTGIISLGRWVDVAVARPRLGVVAFGLTAWVVFGLLVVDFSATVDGAKWDFGHKAVSAGVPAANLDAGVEWFGWHQTGESGPLLDIPGRTWWTTRFPDQPVCGTVYLSDEGTAPVADGLQERYQSLFGHSIVLSLVLGPDSCPDSL